MPLVIGKGKMPGMFQVYKGIVGLGEAEPEGAWWPTEGYDADLYAYNSWDGQAYRPTTQRFLRSGHTREEWLALADVMLDRWAEWRQHILSMPDDTP